MSSGGHLALLAAYHLGFSAKSGRGEHTIGAVVALMPPSDLRGDEFDHELFGASPMDFDPKLIPSLSPIDQVTENAPSTLSIHGTNDKAVNYARNSVRLLKILQDNNVTSKLVSVDAGHEVFPEPIMGNSQAEYLSWFATYLK